MLETLVAPYTRGDPESSLRWISKSLSHLQQALRSEGYPISQTTIGQLLTGELGYSLQAPCKTEEGGTHPDRDAQFQYIQDTMKTFQHQGWPCLSVDTKKKENVGLYATTGREYQKKGHPIPVKVYDFVDKKLGKAVPYGIYDIGRNEGFVNVGNSFDTAEFAVNSIRKWWHQVGQEHYHPVPALLITADGGGSNGSRVRLWKVELQKLANELLFSIHVCPYPPGTSKWNKIEHRMFSVISQNWRGKPLDSLETIVNLIRHAGTQTGLTIIAQHDEQVYVKGRKVTEQELAGVNIERVDFHGEWNYVIHPTQK